MKKIYVILCAAVLSLGANAQAPVATRTGNTGGVTPMGISSSSNQIRTQATGDTLMYSDGFYFYVNATDQAAFQVATEDLDGLPLSSGYASAGYSMDWGSFASTTSDGSVFDMYHPWETPGVDTALTFYATSWFSPAGIADNWLMFGPITIPATGGEFTWRVKNNPAWRDGYEVLVATAGSAPPTSSDFGNPNIYSRTSANPDPNDNVDTVWATITTQLPAYCNGQTTWFAFHHNANDMDVLYIDEILVVDMPMSVTEATPAFSISQNVPNPANGSTTFNYSLTNNSKVSFNVYDITGNLVYAQDASNQAAGAHRIDMNTSTLANGMYFYTITVNGQSETRKMNVSNN